MVLAIRSFSCGKVVSVSAVASTCGSKIGGSLTPSGVNDPFWERTYFSTYSPGDTVNVTSLGGSVTLRMQVIRGSVSVASATYLVRASSISGIPPDAVKAIVKGI